MPETPLEIKVKIALDDNVLKGNIKAEKGEIIEPNPHPKEYVLFACGADEVFLGFERYCKISDRSFFAKGAVRELRYIKVSKD